jgi:hypothetical protein
VKNPKNLSIYIEDPKMDDVHARLFSRKYEDQEQFIIQDLSDHSKPETSGLWI